MPRKVLSCALPYSYVLMTDEQVLDWLEAEDILCVATYTCAHISNCLYGYCSHIFASFHSGILMFHNLFIFLHLNLGKKII